MIKDTLIAYLKAPLDPDFTRAMPEADRLMGMAAIRLERLEAELVAARETTICECEKYLHGVSYSACGLRKKDKDAGINKDVELAASKKEIERLRQSFKAYAFHTSMCAVQHSRNPCDCGFDQANKQATKEE